MIGILIILLAGVAVTFIVGFSISAPRYTGAATDHFNGKVFYNEGITPAGFKEVMKWMTNRQRGEWKEDLREPDSKHPIAVEREHVRITFINHSTFLIQVDGLNILTDPIWSMRASPFQWAGPKRMKKPGIKFENVPKIDVVLLSHNHYDHLDVPSLRMVFGAHHPKIFTPLGVKAFLDSEMISGSTDLDWWNEVRISDSVSIQAVPAQHFSGRGFFDRNATLWCGYVIKTSKGNIYFSGDTGYGKEMFRSIGERSGPIAIALIPVGAYKPLWFMSPIHTSPEDAVKAHLDLKAKQSVGIHFGTFPLADEGENEPKADLTAALLKYNVHAETFILLDQGAVKVFESK